MKRNSVEIKSAISEKRNRFDEIMALAKGETRELTDEENEEVKKLREEIEADKEELKELEEELQAEEEKNKRNITMKKTLVKELRSALDENKKSITFAAENRAVVVQGAEGVHDAVVETEIQGILEPLYANSVLSKLGVRWYKGLPQGDIQVPIMGKGSVGWAGEIENAQATGNTFSTKKLTPKRLTAYVDISKQLIVQDTIGAEEAIRRDIVNALNDKLEATIFGTADKDDTKPSGIFYNVSATTISDYADICDLEADLDDENVGGERKYLLSNKAKAALRCMIKGTNATGMVLENNAVDGTPAEATSNVTGKKFAYGNWNYLAIGSWGDMDITLDPYTQAAKGCIRLVINAYFDAVVLKDEAFAFGTFED